MFIPHDRPKTYVRLGFRGRIMQDSIASDEEATARCFLQALRQPEYDGATLYLSKNFAERIPLVELANAVSESSYKLICGAEFDNPPKNSRTRTVLLLDSANILHLRMIREPDSFANWKIYQVDIE